MNLQEVLAALDAEIAMLQQVRAIILGTPDAGPTSAKVKRGKPAKRTMSPETRAKMAESQRKRHAAKTRAAKKAATEGTA